MKAYRVSEGMALLIRNLDTGWRQAVERHNLAAIPPGKGPWVSLGVGVNVVR
jgi:hypothetical protein